MKAIVPILFLFFLASCQTNCYHCELQSICATCVKGNDSLKFCLPASQISDSLNRLQENAYACKAKSGLQYGTQVCDNEAQVREMEKEAWVCTK